MSQTPKLPIKIPSAEPTLSDLLALVKRDIMLSINCHAVATVTEFISQDPDTGRALVTAKINYDKTFLVQKADSSFQNELKFYPPVFKCPAIVVGGGNVALQIPIQVGDQCLILFNDRDLQNWKLGGRSGPVASSDLHSFNDAVALVGFVLWSNPNTTHAMLTNGNAQIGVPIDNTGKCRIANNSTTLNTLLGSLISAIKSITTSSGSTVSPASQTALTSIATQIAALLE